MTTYTPLWIVTAEFTDRDDAVALIDLARELGIAARLSSRTINEKNGAAPIRETRLGKYLLGSMVPGRSYDLEHFHAICQEHGYAPNSASAVLSRLCEQGDVERLDRGVFRLVGKPAIVLCKDCPTPALCERATFCRQEPLQSGT